jgi:transcriptional regulator with XRE-family HTH domain
MPPTFAQRLKELRAAAGLSQAQLAQRAGLNPFGVAKLEQGVREPAFATVQALARALGVSVSKFEDTAPAESADQPGTKAPQSRKSSAADQARPSDQQTKGQRVSATADPAAADQSEQAEKALISRAPSVKPESTGTKSAGRKKGRRKK